MFQGLICFVIFVLSVRFLPLLYVLLFFINLLNRFKRKLLPTVRYQVRLLISFLGCLETLGLIFLSRN